MVPFLVFGLTTVLYEVLLHLYPVWFWEFAACYVVLLIGLGVGWVKGFPRWSYPYGGLVLVLTWSWMDIPAQNLWAHNIWILKRYNQLLGWRAWIPFLLMGVIALLLTRSVRPLRQLLTGVGPADQYDSVLGSGYGGASDLLPGLRVEALGDGAGCLVCIWTRGGIVWGVLTAVMFAPGLLSLLRKRVESVRAG